MSKLKASQGGTNQPTSDAAPMAFPGNRFTKPLLYHTELSWRLDPHYQAAGSNATRPYTAYNPARRARHIWRMIDQIRGLVSIYTRISGGPPANVPPSVRGTDLVAHADTEKLQKCNIDRMASRGLRITLSGLTPDQASRLMRIYQDSKPWRLSQATAGWLDHKQTRGRDISDSVRHCQRAQEVLGDIEIRDITARDYDRLAAEILRSGARPATANRYCSTLRAVLHWAQDADLVDRVPRFRELDEDNRRERVCSSSEWAQIQKAAKEPYRSLFLAAYETGARLGELLQLRWEDLHFSAGICSVQTGKAKGRKAVRRSVPLSPVLRHRLRQLKRERTNGSAPSGIIWDVRKDACSKQFRIAARSVGIEELRLHDLRRTRATIWALDGSMSPPELLRVMGWRSWETAERYIAIGQHDVAALRAQIGARRRG